MGGVTVKRCVLVEPDVVVAVDDFSGPRTQATLKQLSASKRLQEKRKGSKVVGLYSLRSKL